MRQEGDAVSTGTVTRKRRAAMALALGAALLVAGCTTLYRNHGYVPTEEDLAKVSVGKSTRDQVAEAVGKPTSMGVLEGGDWYYVGSRWRYYGALAPKEVDRQVVAISFDKQGVVENVERFGLERGEVVVLSRRVTKTNIKGIGLVTQLLGSVGRVNAGQLLDNR